MKSIVQEILKQYPTAGHDSLIPILQSVQEKLGFLSEESVTEVSKFLKMPTSKIFGVATFYNQFRFNQPGKYHIQLCRGTACHVLGSATVLDEVEKQLKVKAGQTTRDKLFSLEVVACIGACGLAPVISINGEFHAKVTSDSIKSVLEDYRKREEQQ
ncbi:MAG: NADH-quinone oxidoreductase subunit NuoE [Bacteroidetes bacterium HGW-Bacteroidetes-1]|jgi:NADH-quinone oxidoreductase subunit E|nr:MAG: NADH-quinone oxidoreductase subunit NuoE [Bacteroidetes bacterium HGW-Bacteroidetes-1]